METAAQTMQDGVMAQIIGQFGLDAVALAGLSALVLAWAFAATIKDLLD